MRLQHWLYTVPLRLKSIFHPSRVERELAEELQFHLEHKIEEGLSRGLSADEARDRALRAMDGLEQRKEEIRDRRRVSWLTDFLADLRFAVRSLSRSPGLSGFVVLTLALGIGMTAAPFSMVDALIFRPYPVPHPEQVVSLVSTSRDDAFQGFSYREYLDLRAHTNSYDGLLANTAPVAVGFSSQPGTTPIVRAGMLVSGNYFSVLGVEPQLGRGFLAEEDQVPGRDAVVVLGRDFWKTALGADPEIVGRKVRLNGALFTVLGVAPESFPGMMIFTQPDIYVPLSMAGVLSTNPQKSFFEDRDDRELSLKARLRPGSSLAEARSELLTLAAAFERQQPELYRGRGADVRTQFQMRTRGDDANWKFGVTFTVLALAVLLVACTNVAGLLLSRAETRSREIAVRLALGAGRNRLVRFLLTETLLLSLLGGIGGVVIGYVGIDLLRGFRIPAELPVKIPFRMDTRILLASLVVSLLSAAVCGLAPALQSTGSDLVNGLKAGEVGSRGRRRLWGRDALVVAQVALSLMLLSASFLMARSFRYGVLEEIGFNRDHLLLVRFDPRLAQYGADRTQRFYEQLVERARELPAVSSAAVAQSAPLGLDDFDGVAFVPESFQMPLDRESFTSSADTVGVGFFDTLGIPILRGRGFQSSDTLASPRVAVVNERFAQHYWPGSDAVGKRLFLGGRSGATVEIVGVARNIKYRSTLEKPTDFVYLPLAQSPKARLFLLLRSQADPLQLVDAVEKLVRELDPNLPLLETRSYEDLYRYQTVEGPGVAIELTGTMGMVALLLAVAGLYGLVAYNVSRRTREIGIRMAIGAAPSAVMRMMMSRGLVLVGIGTAFGLAMGFGVERVMNATLFHAGGVDVVAYLVVVPSMVVVTLLAAWLPARRASRIAPTLALRCE